MWVGANRLASTEEEKKMIKKRLKRGRGWWYLYQERGDKKFIVL